jgi:hypothetical protein
MGALTSRLKKVNIIPKPGYEKLVALEFPHNTTWEFVNIDPDSYVFI